MGQDEGAKKDTMGLEKVWMGLTYVPVFLLEANGANLVCYLYL